MSSLRALNLEINNISVINFFAGKAIDLENRAGTKCSYDGSIKSAAGKLLWDFDPVTECGPQFVLYFSVAASAVCTTLSLVLMYHNRWKIRYGLFLCRIHFIGYREIIPQQQREHFEYDMYVVIHDEDEEWTDEIFRRGLEENLPEYDRLAIGDEALMLGMYYLDAVSLLVENSLKLIFLISANALKNHMFLLKFRLALDHVNEVQMEKIVLVFLEDIPDADLPFLIRLFLSDNRAYLVWPRGPEGQVYFWEQLAKYMAVNRYCNPLVPP
ncbi:toll-like receptor 3 [Diadema antillarum]|uniref:toll-like receptor 3 n=1 Tax=Diadema antillarum TaxID=105358 RepID=UPI003A8794C2